MANHRHDDDHNGDDDDAERPASLILLRRCQIRAGAAGDVAAVVRAEGAMGVMHAELRGHVEAQSDSQVAVVGKAVGLGDLVPQLGVAVERLGDALQAVAGAYAVAAGAA